MPDVNGATFSAKDTLQTSAWKHRESRSAAGYSGDLRNWNCNKRAACGANYPVGFALVKPCFTRRIRIRTVDFARNPCAPSTSAHVLVPRPSPMNGIGVLPYRRSCISNTDVRLKWGEELPQDAISLDNVLTDG